MRNLFLVLILANLLFLAWHAWIDPSVPTAVPSRPDDLAVFGAQSPAGPGGPLASYAAGTCLQMGPLPSFAAARQAAERLAATGVDAVPVAREAQEWLGHWVQIEDLESRSAAESARDRLVAGGLKDAYLMQEGALPLISLGVFRDRDRAERVADRARELGFEVGLSERYRPAVEQWLLIRPRIDQTLGGTDLSLAGDRILRTEGVPCAEDSAAGSE
jgi:hypothetical protein